MSGGFNYKRKLFHLLGFILPSLYYFDVFKDSFGLINASRAIIFSILMLQVILLSLTEILRFNNENFKTWFYSNFGMIMKEEEQNRMNATIPYLLANAIVVLFFPAEIFFISVGFLLIGDPVAAYFGSKYGKYRFYNGKSLIGILAFIFASIFVGLIFMIIFSTDSASFFSISLNGEFNYKVFLSICFSGIIAALAEFFSGHGLMGFLDDNLMIPIASAFSLSILFVYLFNFQTNQIFFEVKNLFLVF